MIKFVEWLKLKEMGVGPYIGNCTDTDTYQVLGACSDQNTEKRNKQYRKGFVTHKKVKKHSDKFESYENSSSVFGWLSPEGIFSRLKPLQTHGQYANEFTGLKYPKSMDKMFKDGYQRITMYHPEIASHNPFLVPNDKQKKFLIQFALTNDYESVAFDNEKDRAKVIWHKDDF